MDHKVLTLVAVRLKSNRLPRKALAELYSEPLIIRLTERVQLAKIPANVIWCTSTHPQDDALEQLASERNITCFRGAEMDVMSRFVEVANQENASTVVRVTGDNPFTDPVMMDAMIGAHLNNKAEYTFTEDLPVGTRSEIIDVEMLKRCHKLLQDPNASEYMTWMLNRPDQFKTLKYNVENQKLKRPEIILTVDTESDLRVARAIYENFEGKAPILEHIIHWLDLNPEVIVNDIDLDSTTINEAVNYKLVVD